MRIWLAYVVRDSERVPRMLVSAGNRDMAEMIVRERLGLPYGSGSELVLVAAAVCPAGDVELAIQRDLDRGAP